MRDDALDVLSPELALVDPELAALARARLPEPGAWQPAWREPPSAPGRSVQPIDRGQFLQLPEERRRRQLEPLPGSGPEPRTRVPVGLLVPAAAAALLLAAMGGLFALDRSQADGSRPILGAPASPGAPAAPAAPAPPASRVPVAPPSGSRVFAWAPARKASAYELRLFRRGRLIYRTSAREARVTVPASWVFEDRRYRLTPGRYAWQVRPRLRGDRLGRPIVATFDVS